MKTKTIDVYEYSELSSAAKARARYTILTEYFWIDESINSVRAFCDLFGVKITDWALSPCSYSYILTNAAQDNFRGIKPSSIPKGDDCSLTGYCLDCDILSAFHDSVNKRGDIKTAFNDAIHAGVKSIVNDMEYQDSEEYALDYIEANGYEFDKNGRII